MKIKIISFVLLAITAIAFVPGCEKEPTGSLVEHNTFNVPVVVAPADAETIAPTTSTSLTWSSTGGATDKWDVYFGESSSPDLYKAGHNSQTLTVPVQEGHTYHWYVSTEDANGMETHSPVFSFTVKVTLNIDNFVGSFDCLEPAYGTYTVNSTKVNANTIEIDNFWDSGMVLQYTFDELGNVEIIEKVFPQSATVTFVVSGHGTYDNSTGNFIVDYEVVRNTYTFKIEGNTVASSVLDSNTHTFTKK